MLVGRVFENPDLHVEWSICLQFVEASLEIGLKAIVTSLILSN